ncbi:MAG: valine--tRNA ligase [Saprospiraceae bacterium]|nr:valine--tRNA ligase [Saprospiraceae bacterium]
MELSTTYNPQETEDKWYAHWIEKNYFHSEPNEKEAYSIVIPPPNVTGVLHMGHMLNNTIQDILIRKARLEGKNACWVPGTDHASIATEAKVVRMLREKGIKKSDLSRDEFLEYAMAWKEEYGGKILQQLRKLGASCDWERTAFTMDEVRSDAVYQAFVDLYNKGKLYRGLRMVNWDPEAQTVLSNEEVLHEEETTQLYHVKYQVEGSDEFITIATTRPETIMGDSAIAVHPEDPRYTKMKGKNVIVPMVNRVIPIIFDDYVDREFGTGALKITPAHDVNDYEIGKRHNLEVIDVINDNGTISEAGQVFVGEDRFVARKMAKKKLTELGNLVEVEDYTHSVGRSERTKAVVEPKLSLQWYVDMKSLAEPALDAVVSDEVEFFPKNQKNLYKHWMENIRDWCISRQLWWGHRIPAWYYGEEVIVAKNEKEALIQAKEKTGNSSLTLADLKQDDDVLDTWFSSWLWPISLFDGFNSREEMDYYYPTSVLVTGWDIIFLWVARMIMAGYEWETKRPFDHVYFTGMVRDNQRRKMSKQLGNSPDALALIDKFGADGVRFGMLRSSPAGGDLLFDDKLCDQGSKFSNKLWNAIRLIEGWEIDPNKESNEVDALAAQWFENKTNAILADLETNFKEYRLSEALTNLYNFIWNDYCSLYLEMIKPPYGEGIAASVRDQAKTFYEQLCIILHPFMPFITEEIWHILKERNEGEDCVVSTYPTAGKVDMDLIKTVDQAKDIISNIANIRAKNGLKKFEPLELVAIESDKMNALLHHSGISEMISKVAILKEIRTSADEGVEGASFISGTEKFYVLFEKEIDVAAEIEKLEKDLEYQLGFASSISKKLSNERFVNNAPEAVVNNERKKLADGEARIKIIKEEIEKLKG